MMSAKLLLNWLDRNPSSLLDDYDTFRAEVLQSALDLADILVCSDSWPVHVCVELEWVGGGKKKGRD